MVLSAARFNGCNRFPCMHVLVFVDHVAFRMPGYVNTVPMDLNKLLDDWERTTIATHRVLPVTVVAEESLRVFKVRVFGTEHHGTVRA